MDEKPCLIPKMRVFVVIEDSSTKKVDIIVWRNKHLCKHKYGSKAVIYELFDWCHLQVFANLLKLGANCVYRKWNCICVCTKEICRGGSRSDNLILSNRNKCGKLHTCVRNSTILALCRPAIGKPAPRESSPPPEDTFPWLPTECRLICS